MSDPSQPHNAGFKIEARSLGMIPRNMTRQATHGHSARKTATDQHGAAFLDHLNDPIEAGIGDVGQPMVLELSDTVVWKHRPTPHRIPPDLNRSLTGLGLSLYCPESTNGKAKTAKKHGIDLSRVKQRNTASSVGAIKNPAVRLHEPAGPEQRRGQSNEEMLPMFFEMSSANTKNSS
jgi:hypothetical protein